jgi:phytoene dehydrogenase-like protein
MVKSCRRFWTSEIADSIARLKQIRFDNPTFRLATSYDREDFTRLLTERFGVPAATVEEFFATVRRMSFYDSQGDTTKALFDRFFPGREDVVRLLLEPIAYANGSILEDPALTYGIVFSNFMSKGVYTFRGGTDRLVGLMEAELRRNGADLRIRSGVEKIVVDNRRVTGVSVRGRAIKARAVISNANLKGTIFQLVGPEHFDGDFVEAARAVRLNNSSTQVYMALRAGESLDEAACGDLVFSSTAPVFRSDLLLSRNVTSRTFSFYYPAIRPQRSRFLVVASSNANYHDWAELAPDDYRRAKRDLVEDTLRALEQYAPGIRDKLDCVECATPRTFQRYTGHWNGAAFGTKFEGLAVSRRLGQEVAGLYHAGSVGIIMSGWLGALNYGVIVANDVDTFLMNHSSQTPHPDVS